MAGTAILYFENEAVAAVNVEKETGLHHRAVDRETEVICSFEGMLDNAPKNIPLYCPDSEGNQYLNQLQKGDFLTWSRSQVQEPGPYRRTFDKEQVTSVESDSTEDSDDDCWDVSNYEPTDMEYDYLQSTLSDSSMEMMCDNQENENPYKLQRTNRKGQQLSITLWINYHVICTKNDPKDVLMNFVSLAVMLGLDYSLFASKYVAYFIAKHFPECKNLFTEENVLEHITASATMVREQLRKFFDTHNLDLLPRRVGTEDLLGANLLAYIVTRFTKLKKVRLPWVSIETESWTPNNRNSCISVTLSLVTGDMERAVFPIYFEEVKTMKKKALTETLLSHIRKLSVSKFVTSCCTDDESALIKATDLFKENEQFPFFNSHSDCAVQIQHFVKALLGDITENLQRDTGDSGLGNGADDLDCFPHFCSVHIVRSLIKLSIKLKNSFNLEDDFTDYMETIPPLYCETRWDSIFYLLEHFLENVEGYEKFKVSMSRDHKFLFDFCETDVLTTKILHEAMKPFASLTKLLSLNKPASICYFPLLLYCEEMSSECASRLSKLLGRPVELQKFKAKYEKYYAKACASNYIHMLTALFHHDGVKVFKIFRTLSVDPYSALADVAFKIMNYEIIENGAENSKAEGDVSSDERHDFMEMKEVEGVFAESNFVKEFKGTTREHLLKEIKEFRQFWMSVFDRTVTRLEHELDVDIRILDYCDFELPPGSASEFHTVDVFCLRTLLSWDIISQYLDATRYDGNNSRVRVWHHTILPNVLDYLLSINVTSVNSEESFSKFKKMFNKRRESLGDESAINELLLRSTITSLNLDLSVEEIKEIGLKELLDCNW
ncbi:uncharacterized protein KNAG_0C05200 [Huiozyma naganishii CBS 8797]|uniref:HAT C-terminal dimerisation domain-containing protein n=1 Tax=Huiozyma naganishii (strain ATCC MYA-139 / BCRC 22969 / CBS 8797 / KCTC 17520 / NBRC 10181 / NCYC 3082 / Yp74L-3) TaxID=1071383 RepID=J7S697_HUIN7|nr:hypothetical protein KNAG_0C05200 [Kazachstania naganishii CBS 8797]CCK69621.1 hypothetical protein KNAG_0C05200 [Kazachstania naganishii CBS 8797]